MPSLNDFLIFAASAGNYMLVRERVEAGADIHHTDIQKGSALYAGIRSAQCIAYLLSRGADPNGFVSTDGQTALDHALSMIPYYTAQSAYLLHRAGGRSNVWSVLPPPSSDSVLIGRLSVGDADWFRRYTLGQVCFGSVREAGGKWDFDCDGSTSAGHFFRIEALYSPDRLNLHCIERGDDGFALIDLRGRAHQWTGYPDLVELDAAITIL